MTVNNYTDGYLLHNIGGFTELIHLCISYGVDGVVLL